MDAEAEGREGGDQQQHAEQALLLELEREDQPGVGEFVRHVGDGGREADQVGADRHQALAEVLAERDRLLGRRRRQVGGRRGGGAARDPVAHRRVGEEAEELADLLGRRAGGRRGVGERGRRAAREQRQRQRECHEHPPDHVHA